MSDPATLLRDSRQRAGLWAIGHRLELNAPARHGGVDETLVRQQLELSPRERLNGLEAMYAQAYALALAGAHCDGHRP